MPHVELHGVELFLVEGEHLLSVGETHSVVVDLHRLADREVVFGRAASDGESDRRVHALRRAGLLVLHVAALQLLLLRLLSRLVLVVGVLLHVHLPESLGLGDVRGFLLLRQLSPAGAQLLRDLRVVHVRLVLADLPPLQLGPDHEGVHRSLDVARGLLGVRGV